jgi:nucleoside-diphosphate-sugar epimerase
MSLRVFVAGATGVIGARLVPLLVAAGYQVAGMSRSAARAAAVRAAGAGAVIVDVFDAPALQRALLEQRPDVVIHQLTDLPRDLDPKLMVEATVRNARIRSEGTKNLVQAALAAGAQRLIAQSVAWMYAPGPEPHSEGDALELASEGSRAISARGVADLERLTLSSPALTGVVLRYGQLYGPGSSRAQAEGSAPVHADAAAHAALLAVERGAGIYNVAEETPYATSSRARAELGWDPDYRVAAGSAEP